MIVTCPSCETSFAVDESLLGPRGRKVRCGECAHRWHQMPESAAEEPAQEAPAPAAEPEPAPEPAPEPQVKLADEAPNEPEAVHRTPAEEDTEEAAPPPVRGPKLFEAEEEDILDDGDRRFAVLGWSIFLIVFILIGCGFYFGQKPIVAFEPRFQKLYDLVGLSAHDEAEVAETIPGEGLSIPAEKLLKSRKRVGGDPMIVIEGIVVNETELDQSVPTLRATVANAKSEILARWYFEADAARIGPSDEVTFGTSIADDWGDQGIGISIIFVSDETEQNEPSIGPSPVAQW